ncbi:phospholipase D-like domain-containing protein [Brevundimonas nasdae]|uniref:phospholipase D-like domain-containing protein n=1 Tax=Brevundimonas nasdae TaxID=172043 RepID=UPI000A04E06C|nr:phospholipase D family protein [Brevundimonas nasdae]
MKIEVVSQGGVNALSIAAALKPHALTGRYDRLDVAVAYATDPGLRALGVILEGWPPGSRWIVGLDDAVTQPAAIKRLQALPGADFRIAKLAPVRRFHPKLYHLWSSANPAHSVLLIGSANMTERGLHKNAEVGVLLEAESAAETQKAHAAFTELWNLGRAPSAGEIEAYQDLYAVAAAARKTVADRGAAPPPSRPNDAIAPEIPSGLTSENVIAMAVMRIAAQNPNGICSYDEGRRKIPLMLALTSQDLSASPSQGEPRWIQRLRNIQSNSDGGEASTNFIKNGLLMHVPRIGYQITEQGRELLRATG